MDRVVQELAAPGSWGERGREIHSFSFGLPKISCEAKSHARLLQTARLNKTSTGKSSDLL